MICTDKLRKTEAKFKETCLKMYFTSSQLLSTLQYEHRELHYEYDIRIKAQY